jgi:vacuolar-type H+-ATPase subunit C/Vma6
MIRTSRYAFLLAKIYGILAKSFVGTNYRDIVRLRTVTELYDRLYPGERRESPEYQLIADLERRAAEEAVRTMVYVLEQLGDPPRVLVHLLRRYEYLTVKSVLRTVAYGLATEPVDWDLGRWDQLRRGEGQDWRDAVAASPYAWALATLEKESLLAAENALDKEYYQTLARLVQELPSRDRAGVGRLVSLETSVTNALWALRLRFLFGMDAEHATGYLIPAGGREGHRVLMQAFDIPADSLEGWRRWKFGWLIEDQLSEAFHAPDPVRAERQAARRMYIRSHQLFHQDPFTLTPLVAFFRLKEYEASMLATAAEALRLGVPGEEVLMLAGLA